MTQLDVAHDSIATHPSDERRKVPAFGVALIAHVCVILAFVLAQRAHVVRLGVAPQHQGIGAFISPGTSVGTAGTSKPVTKTTPAPEKTPKKVMPASTAETPGSEQAAGASGGQGGGAGAVGPIRLGSGQGLTPIKKVEPVYPAVMQAARVEGTVVLDAIIHRDGTVGDIKVLKSTGALFERAAIDAVRQWLYAPIPYEGLLTVTVNFTLR